MNSFVIQIIWYHFLLLSSKCVVAGGKPSSALVRVGLHKNSMTTTIKTAKFALRKSMKERLHTITAESLATQCKRQKSKCGQAVRNWRWSSPKGIIICCGASYVSEEPIYCLLSQHAHCRDTDWCDSQYCPGRWWADCHVVVSISINFVRWRKDTLRPAFNKDGFPDRR
jgi:hypothetical protein